MNRAQKKARLKRIKQNQKAAKRRKHEDNPHGDDALRETGERAAATLDQARECVNDARRISDERARDMLERAAEFLSDVVEMTRETLREVPLERRREAARIIESKPEDRPRGSGADPVVILTRIGMQAAGLLQRILRDTNPRVRKLAA